MLYARENLVTLQPGNCREEGYVIITTINADFKNVSSSYQFSQYYAFFFELGKNNDAIINRCPNYLHLLIWSMQTYIKTWWTLKCSHYTPIFDDFNWPHLFWVFPVFTANEKVWFPGEAIHGRNICSDYKCSLRLLVWLYSQQLPSFYQKYFFIKLPW